MGLTIARLAAETRSFTWKVLGEDVAVTYRPGVLTWEWDEQPTHEALAATLISIDITNGTGKPIGVTAASLRKHLPWPFMVRLAKAIYADSSLDPTTAETSGDS